MCVSVYCMTAYEYTSHIHTITMLLLSLSSANINSFNSDLILLYPWLEPLPIAGTRTVNKVTEDKTHACPYVGHNLTGKLF